MAKKKRVLFFAEAVTLAHVARPFVLAEALDPEYYDVIVAADPRYAALFADSNITTHKIWSIPTSQFLLSLAEGKPVYDLPTLSRYVEEDLEVIEQLSPDLIVGDFRLSLLVSAAKAGIPYVSLINAYWSPYVDVRYTVPDLPLVHLLGATAGQLLFDAVRPIAFALHAVPINRLRRRFGLGRLPWDLRHVYTSADYTLYADLPDLFRMRDLPENHAFIGPINWSPTVELPAWWERLPEDEPIVYLTLGSSGATSGVPAILAGLARLGCQVIVGTAGRVSIDVETDKLHTADYIPGDLAAERADLVVCNGGSPSSYQALAAGKPVLGIPSNLDQYLNMQGVVNAGAGQLLRSDAVDEKSVLAAVDRLLHEESCRKSSELLGHEIEKWDAPSHFRKFVAGM